MNKRQMKKKLRKNMSSRQLLKEAKKDVEHWKETAIVQAVQVIRLRNELDGYIAQCTFKDYKIEQLTRRNKILQDTLHKEPWYKRLFKC